MATKQTRSARRQNPATDRPTCRQYFHPSRQRLRSYRQQQTLCRHPPSRRPSRTRQKSHYSGQTIPPHQRQRPTPKRSRQTHHRHRARITQSRSLKKQKRAKSARLFSLHPVQRYFTNQIPPKPISARFIPFISQSLYIYLNGFQKSVQTASLFILHCYIRAVDGYALGAVLGIIAVIAVSILLPYVQKWQRRFLEHE